MNCFKEILAIIYIRPKTQTVKSFGNSIGLGEKWRIFLIVIEAFFDLFEDLNICDSNTKKKFNVHTLPN